MFYSHFILARKGPLGIIWIAAHLQGKLRKNQVTETNISASVDSILFPDVPIALRLSGHLLLGVVRIYSRKVNYLYHDCSEALVKIKQAFHCSSVDLPPEASKVAFHSITLRENFDLDELEASFKWDKIHTLSGESMDDHVSARDLITLQDEKQEHFRGSLFDLDERFPGSSDPYSILFESNKEHAEEPLHASSQVLLHQEIGVLVLEEEVLPPFPVDEEMELDREEVMHTDQGVPLSVGEKGKSSVFHPQSIPDIEKLRAAPERKGPEPFFMELLEEQLPSSNTPLKPSQDNGNLDELGFRDVEVTPGLHETSLSSGPSPIIGGEYDKYSGNEDVLGEILGGRTPAFKVASPSGVVQESAQQKRKRRKRKPFFDDNPSLSSMSMKKQLAGASDLLRQRSKILRMDCEVRGFGMPSLPGMSGPLRDLYSCFTGLPSEAQRCTSRINEETYTQFYEDRVRDPEAEFPVGDKDPLHNSEAPVYSHHSSPQYITQQISANNAEENGMDTQESQIPCVSGAAAGQQDEFIAEVEIGQHMVDAGDTLTSVCCPPEASGQADDMIVHSEAFATQASSKGAKHTTPVSSPELTHTPARTLNVSAHGNDGVPKLDFLEATRDNGAEDPFINETETNSHKKEKLSHNSYGWSVRTKSVAKYLKSIFEKMEATSGGSQPVQVSLDSLLNGRPRKEAARLYFETLVLKSRDYIDVEQKAGFAEIMLSSTPLLRKDIL
ncbi:hypothetical protein GOP47_0024755 [Adiantum capillus-veneris]|uniref:Uncharacterized protein n=1 Tax=Adiantum capillus-veneris TaxID=13818 RepID=A0A9D4U2Q4_ADICA|nr:hypothetical protein GOP47_0024755 [Adiantum capillus-veneris]